MRNTELLKIFEQALLTQRPKRSLEEMSRILHELGQRFQTNGYVHKQLLVKLMEQIVNRAQDGIRPVTGDFVLLMLHCHDFLHNNIDSDSDIPQAPGSIVIDDYLLGVELMRMAAPEPSSTHAIH